MWDFGRRTFNCRVVFVDEMTLDQLDGQARFTDTTAADHNQLIFSEKLNKVRDNQ